MDNNEVKESNHPRAWAIAQTVLTLVALVAFVLQLVLLLYIVFILIGCILVVLLDIFSVGRLFFRSGWKNKQAWLQLLISSIFIIVAFVVIIIQNYAAIPSYSVRYGFHYLLWLIPVAGGCVKLISTGICIFVLFWENPLVRHLSPKPKKAQETMITIHQPTVTPTPTADHDHVHLEV